MTKPIFTMLLGASLILATCGCQQQKELTADEAKAIAQEAYIFAYPMLENYKMMFVQAVWTKSPVYEAPFNQISHKSVLLGPEFTAIVRPNNDTFYSILWMDLRAEPMILKVPAIEDERYYSFQLIDLYTHNLAYIGTRSTGFEAGTYMIAGPGWTGETPAALDATLRTESNFAVALGRTQVFGPGDIQNAKEIQKGYVAQPLSQYLSTMTPEPPATLDFPPYDAEKARSVEFISYLNFLLGQTKPNPEDQEMLDRFSRIGIAPGKSFSTESMDPEMLVAINDGIEGALKEITQAMEALGVRKNGWMQVSGAFGTREAMKGKHLTRAAAAMFGLWGNTLEEAYYPETSLDENGEPLDGSKHNYILHFDADRLPPVKGFWSFSMYKLPEQLFVENPLKRYVISSATEGLVYNADGSLDVYLQKSSPGKDKQPNWLPAYDGPFSLQARLYWPSPEMLDPLYVLPPVKKSK